MGKKWLIEEVDEDNGGAGCFAYIVVIVLALFILFAAKACGCF